MSISRTGSIKIDEEEYLKIVKQKIRKDLKRYLTSGQIRFATGDRNVIILLVDEIEIPTFRHGFINRVGIAQGPGKEGDDLGPAPTDNDGEGKEAGHGHGHGGRGKILIDLTPEEFSDLIQELLELPRIKPKGDRTIHELKEKYNTVSRKGPHSMIHLRRTIIEAIKRSIGEGTYEPPEKTKIIPQNNDLWFKSFDMIEEPKNNAIIFFMRDVSGSMGAEERKSVNFLCDLCEFWLSRNYDRLEKVYIIHDARASEVDREGFFTEDWQGGTICSTVLVKMHEIIDERFPVSQWNIYPIYLSDGFNFSSDDKKFIDIMAATTLPAVNQFSYGQIDLVRPWLRAYKSSGAKNFSMPGTLGEKLQNTFKDEDNFAMADITTGSDEEVIEAIRNFFKKGN